jgi:hypothetical protein
MDTKTCSRCKQTKPIEQFHRNRAMKDGRTSDCAVCRTPLTATWNKAHPKYHNQKAKEFRARNPDKVRDWELRRKLGVPVGTYAAMLVAQHGKCAICGTKSPGIRIKRFHVDHDAITGAIRGLLCGRCNTGIGQLLHDQSILLSAIKYLNQKLQS